jgi:alpha-methylacyl-CoA racemase
MDAIGPVPLAAMILTDLGADVVRIERPGGQSAYDNLGEDIVHRGRLRVELDLKTSDGLDYAFDLISRADALVEGFRPGVMEKLGIGPDVCLGRNPRLVYARMTGWGQNGPRAVTAGHDINYIALSGALGMIGEDGACPRPPINFVGDYGGGAMFLVTAVLSGVLAARSSGRGDVVDVAMTDGVSILMSMFFALRQQNGWNDRRGNNLLDGAAPFYRCYECADGRHVAVGAIEPQFFRALVIGLELDPAEFDQHDRTRWADVSRQFADCFVRRTCDEWAVHFEKTDACVTPVLTIPEAIRHPDNTSRSAHVEVHGLVHPSVAPRFSRYAGAITASRMVTPSEAISIFGAQTLRTE